MDADVRIGLLGMARVGSWSSSWFGLTIIVTVVGLQSGVTLGGAPSASLASLRARVAAAVQDEARARTFDARSAAVRRLLDVHREIGGHPRFAASGALQGVQRQAAIRLASIRQALLRDYGERRDTAGGGANQALALVDIIQQTVHPDFWDVHGGPGKVAYFEQGRGLVVLGTEQVHDDVGNLLDQLRRVGP
jgi:hypothetical protein